MSDRSRNDAAQGEKPLREASRAPMPRSARFALFGALLLAMVGALYLIFARGDALLVDLAKIGRAFCF